MNKDSEKLRRAPFVEIQANFNSPSYERHKKVNPNTTHAKATNAHTDVLTVNDEERKTYAKKNATESRMTGVAEDVKSLWSEFVNFFRTDFWESDNKLDNKRDEIQNNSSLTTKKLQKMVLSPNSRQKLPVINKQKDNWHRKGMQIKRRKKRKNFPELTPNKDGILVEKIGMSYMDESISGDANSVTKVTPEHRSPSSVHRRKQWISKEQRRIELRRFYGLSPLKPKERRARYTRKNRI